MTGQADAALQLGEARLLARPEGVRREIELAALYAGAELADKAFAHLEPACVISRPTRRWMIFPPR